MATREARCPCRSGLPPAGSVVGGSAAGSAGVLLIAATARALDGTTAQALGLVYANRAPCRSSQVKTDVSELPPTPAPRRELPERSIFGVVYPYSPKYVHPVGDGLVPFDRPCYLHADRGLDRGNSELHAAAQFGSPRRSLRYRPRQGVGESRRGRSRVPLADGSAPAHLVAISTRALVPELDRVLSVRTIRTGQDTTG